MRYFLMFALIFTSAFAQQQGTLTDTRDGKTYKTVKIGEQVWMAENLNLKVGNARCYDDKESNCEKYGRLYPWVSAKNACPKDWHMPSYNEWKTLFKFVDKGYFASEDNIAGIKLRAKKDWFSDAASKKSNSQGTDDYGFAALPGGMYISIGDRFGSIGQSGTWWSTTENNYIGMNYYLKYAYSFASITKNKTDGYSIRCIQGAAPEESEEKFSTTAEEKGTFKDSRDNKTYKYVKIGGKVWMAENLNYKTGKSMCYDNKESNCEKYGRLYDWNTAVKACPSGWHLSKYSEWKSLLLSVDKDISSTSGNKAARKLKATVNWRDMGKYPNDSGTDDYGFAALPGGGYYDNKFENLESSGNWWSDSTYSKNQAYFWNMGYAGANAAFYGYNLSKGFSVRCVKDN